jgi:hypothetical protein
MTVLHTDTAKKDPAALSLRFFETHLLEHTRTEKESEAPLFLTNDLTRMIDFFVQR